MRNLIVPFVLLLALAACRGNPEPLPNPAEVSANFTASPLTGSAPLDVEFDATASTGDDLSFAWDFGDDAAAATGPLATYTFLAAGEFDAQLTVTDRHGTSDSFTVSISVNAP